MECVLLHKPSTAALPSVAFIFGLPWSRRCVSEPTQASAPLYTTLVVSLCVADSSSYPGQLKSKQFQFTTQTNEWAGQGRAELDHLCRQTREFEGSESPVVVSAHQ